MCWIVNRADHDLFYWSILRFDKNWQLAWQVSYQGPIRSNQHWHCSDCKNNNILNEVGSFTATFSPSDNVDMDAINKDMNINQCKTNLLSFITV